MGEFDEYDDEHEPSAEELGATELDDDFVEEVTAPSKTQTRFKPLTEDEWVAWALEELPARRAKDFMNELAVNENLRAEKDAFLKELAKLTK